MSIQNDHKFLNPAYLTQSPKKPLQIHQYGKKIRKYLFYLFIHLNRCCSNSREIKTGRNRNIPCVVHHGNIFHHLYAKNHLLEKEECNKLMQGVCRRMRTTCFYLNSPTIMLGNASRCPFSHLRRTKRQLHPLFYRHGCDQKESPSPKVSRL